MAGGRFHHAAGTGISSPALPSTYPTTERKVCRDAQYRRSLGRVHMDGSAIVTSGSVPAGPDRDSSSTDRVLR